MEKLLAETSLASALAEDTFSYWTFKDLQARRIVTSRTDLTVSSASSFFPSPSF